LGLLPGEDPAAFEKLHKGLIAELTPNGPLEEDIVSTIARLVWRKQNLATFQRAERGRDLLQGFTLWLRAGEGIRKEFPEKLKKMAQVVSLVHQEMGDLFELAAMERKATVEALLEELDVEDRLDARIGRSLKQLTYLKGLKSLASLTQIAPPPRAPEASAHITQIATTSRPETVDDIANLPAAAGAPPSVPETLVMVEGPPLGTNESEGPINTASRPPQS
jgi:hypothetical protein